MKPSSDPSILAHGLHFPEGPAFDPAGRLWFVELKGESLGMLEHDRVTRIATGSGSEPNGIAIDALARVWFCDAGRCAIRRYTPASNVIDDVATHLDGVPLFRPNDLCFDADGNLLFTCPGDSRTVPTGYVCCLSPDGALKRIAEGLYFPNGLALTPDGRHLIIAETRRQRLWRGRWDAGRKIWVGPRPWASVGGNIGPDGMAFAADGNLWVAIYSSGSIKIVTPDGEVEALIDVPGANPTNCAFDPSGTLGLVVTEAEKGLLLSYPTLGPGAALFK